MTPDELANKHSTRCPICGYDGGGKSVGSSCLGCGLTTEPLLKCPVCRYDLRGLPRKHRCPECGFEYDETTYVWTLSAVPFVLWFSTAIFWALYFLFTAFFLPRSMSRLMLSAGVCLLALFLIFKTWRSKCFLAVTSKGITYRLPLFGVRSIPWDEIEVASPSRRSKRQRLTHGKWKQPIPEDEFRKRGRADVHHELLGRWHRWKDANPS